MIESCGLSYNKWKYSVLYHEAIYYDVYLIFYPRLLISNSFSTLGDSIMETNHEVLAQEPTLGPKMILT